MKTIKIILLCIFIYTAANGFAAEGDFISVWNTEFAEPEGSDIIILPLVPEGSYDFEVDWGDGNSERISKWNDAAVRHEYAGPGVYTVTINGKIEGWSFNSRSAGFTYHLSRSCLAEIRQWGCLDFGQGNISSGAFRNCENLAVTAADAPGLSQSTSLEFFFLGYRGTTINNIENWDVSNIMSMRSTFAHADNFNADISGWDTSSVRNMGHMFQSADAYNRDLSSWNTSGVTTMESMFVGAEAFNGDVSAWDTSQVTDMSYMFNNARNFDGDLSGWDTSAVTTMAGMFINTDKFNCDLSGWDTSSVTDMRSMFWMAKAFNSNLSGWDVSAVKDMAKMFYKAAAFNGDVSSWNMSGVQSIALMFASCPLFNCDISGWDTSSVSNMASVFENADNFNIDISSWDTGSVRTMRCMFSKTEKFNQDLSSWDTRQVSDMSGMFSWTQEFNGNIAAWDTSAVTDMSYMFMQAESFNGDISSWDTSNVKNMNSMFYKAESFNAEIGSWDTGNVIKMSGMFSNAYSFDRDLSGWDIGNAADISGLFYKSGLSEENYDRILIGWSKQNVKKNLSLVSSTRYTPKAGEARQKLIAKYGWSIEDQGPAPYNKYVPALDSSFDKSLSDLDKSVDAGLSECLPADKYEKQPIEAEPGELIRIKYYTTGFFDSKDVAAKVREFRDFSWKFRFGKTRLKKCVDILGLPYAVFAVKNDPEKCSEFSAAGDCGDNSIVVILEYGYLKLYFSSNLVLKKISFDEQTMMKLSESLSMNSWYCHSFRDSYITLANGVRFRMKLLEITEKLGDFAKTVDMDKSVLRGFLEKGQYEFAEDKVLYRFTVYERNKRYAVFFREYGIGFLLKEDSDGIIQAYETIVFAPYDFFDLQ